MQNNYLLPFFTIRELKEYIYTHYKVIGQLLNNEFPFISNLIPNNKAAEYNIRPLFKKYNIEGEVYYSMGLSKATSQYFLRKSSETSIVEIYTHPILWETYREEDKEPVEGKHLKQLEYIFSIDTANNELVNFRPTYLLENISSAIPNWNTHSNIPYLSLGLGKTVDATYGMYNYCPDANFKSCFKHECIWQEVTYPVHVFNSEGVFFTLLNSWANNNLNNRVKCLPKILATQNNSFITVHDTNKNVALYLGGSTTYVEDLKALENLKLILFEYIYKNSHITKKYNYVAFSINHQKHTFKEDRVCAVKLVAYPNNTNPNGIVVNLNSSFKGLTIINSSKTDELSKKLENWLERFNLYTDSLTTSNYLVEVKEDFLIKVAHYLSTNLTALSQL